MSLNGAMQVGRTALTASQTAIQVAGNNMANAATEGFNRRTVHLTPLRGEMVGPRSFIGQGVGISSIRREMDSALQQRYRMALSDENSSLVAQRFLTSLESIQSELTDNDLSSMMSRFFGAFSELANSPGDSAVREVVVQQGVSLASRFADMRSEYGRLRTEIDRSLTAAVDVMNGLLDQVGQLNGEIATTEAGFGEASDLRDQRDRLVDEISRYVDVTAVEQESGAVNLLIGSAPVVLGNVNRGVELRVRSEDNSIEVSLRVAADGTNLQPRTGTIGGLLRQRAETVDPAIDSIDEMARQLIFQVNRLHSQGQSDHAVSMMGGSYGVNDITANLNASASGLEFSTGNGSFLLHLTHAETGQRTVHEIAVDGNAMSLQDLVNSVNAATGGQLTASINAARQLELQAAPGFTLSFSQDSSGALAALGVNSFFSGQSASSISVVQALQDDPRLLAAGADHVPGSNGTAIAIANLQDERVSELGGRSLREYWQNQVSRLAVRASGADAAAGAASVVRESLHAQIQAVSGVSLDEEAINLLTFQRQFQAAARYISTIDEAMQTLLSLA